MVQSSQEEKTSRVWYIVSTNFPEAITSHNDLKNIDYSVLLVAHDNESEEKKILAYVH